MTEKLPHDEFVDKLLLRLHTDGAPSFMREVVDKVFRPTLLLLDTAKEQKQDATVVIDAIETTLAMIITNFVSRVADPEDPAQHFGANQEILDNISLRIQDDLNHRFNPKPAHRNVLMLPPRRGKPK